MGIIEFFRINVLLHCFVTLLTHFLGEMMLQNVS